MAGPLTVSVIIAHFRGDVLSACLASLYERTTGADIEIIVVDDGVENDGSVDRALQRFPKILVERTSGRRGYGAACNAGLRRAGGSFVFFLNNDAEVSNDWLPPLLKAAERHPSVGFFQPKLLSFTEPGLFPWGGGCGGEIDHLGYPFMRGNFIFNREADIGQYDSPADVFWANGAALFARHTALERTGPFDEDFYMQMEDVDLSWRAHLLGIGVRTVPDSVVYHHGGWTLRLNTIQRYFLSHRNSTVLLIKNIGGLRAWVFVPGRIAVELVGALYALAGFGNWRLALGSVGGLAWIALHFPRVLRRRWAVQARRTVSDEIVFSKIHHGSILFDYLFRGVRVATQLHPIQELDAR